MQLEYIWINSFRSIAKMGFNLSSKYLFEINSKSDELQMELLIKDNPEFIPNFFESETIQDVCAIIGKNGVGKSTILKYLKSHLPSGLNANLSNDIIVLSEIENDKNILNIYYPKSIKLKVNSTSNTKFKMIEYDHFRKTDNISYIYFSLNNDYDEGLYNFHGLIDISTTNLFNKLRADITDENVEVLLKKDLFYNQSDLNRLGTWDWDRIQEFRIYAKEKDFPLDIQIPNKIRINILRNTDSYFFQNSYHDQNFSQYVNSVRNLPTKYVNIEKSFLGELLYSLFIDHLLQERKYSTNVLYAHNLSIEGFNSRDEYILRYFSSMENVKFKHEFQGELVDVSVEYLRKFLEVPNFFKLLESMIENGYLKVNSIYSAIGTITDNNEREFNLLNQYKKLLSGFTTFINYSLEGLSTGELSYLSLMARFLYVAEDHFKKLKKNLFVMIDEGDLGYHPEWQRKFLFNCLRLFEWLFPNKKIQIVITSNTPFITSDLPKSKILYIEKDNNLNLLTKSKSENIETFAANIHSLFSETFYLNGLLIGDYSKYRINEIINYLKDKEIIDVNYNYKKIILSIGEPILKHKLIEMWKEKFGRKEELEFLKRRIQEIEEGGLND